MSEDWNVGACALLSGIHTTAERFGLTHVEVVACLLCLRVETSPLLQSLRKMLHRQMQSFGLHTAAENFGVGEEVVKIVCGEVENGEKREERPERPKVFEVLKPSAPDPTVPAKPPAAAVPKPPAAKPTAPPVPEKKLEPLLPHFKQRVRLLYDLKVRVRVISALFGVTSELVHSWGDFTRLHSPDKHLLQRSALQDKLDHGMSLRDAAKEMKMTYAAAETLLGLCPEYDQCRRIAPSIRSEAVAQAKQNSSKIYSVAKRFKVPKSSLKRWLKGDFSLEDGESAYIKGEDPFDVVRKRRCLEQFYVTGEAGRAAAATAYSIEQVKAIVSEFENKVSGKAPANGDENVDPNT